MRKWATSAHFLFVWCFFLLSLIPAASGQSYSSAAIVNSATNQPVLAPNTFATIYGKDFSLGTRSLQPGDMDGTKLPLTLPGTGVRVTVDNVPAPIWFASPTQINFLVPSDVMPSRNAVVQVTALGRAGPPATVNLMPVSPGLFQSDPETPVCARLDGSLVKSDSPILPGEDIVLYATGLGPTVPVTPPQQVATAPAPLAQSTEFRILLNGSPVSPAQIRYAGAAPGFAGLYQINLRVPSETRPRPEIHIAIGQARSQDGLRLPVK